MIPRGCPAKAAHGDDDRPRYRVSMGSGGISDRLGHGGAPARDPMTSDAAQRPGEVFDAVAEAYDAVRPGYPAGLIELACAFGGLDARLSWCSRSAAARAS